MDVLSLLLGTALVLTVFGDAMATTLSVSSGPAALSGRLTGRLWRLMLRLHTRDRSRSPLRLGGLVLLGATVLLWVLGLWTGWTLVFLGADGDVVDATTGAGAGVGDTAYYVGFTIFTLGVGDYTATTTAARLLTTVASFSGLFLITMAITYLLAVVQAVVARRALAVRILALGRTADEIVARAWTGSQFSSAFVQHLVDLTGQVAQIAEQHLAYPVLHYFHTGERSTSASRALALLDDAMLLLSAGIAAQARPDDSAVTPLREAIGRYLLTASITSATPTGAEPPPLPSSRQIHAVGIPLTGPGRLERAATGDRDRRTALRELVHGDGWSWPHSP